MSEPIGLYLHIPFCRSKCAYCDFPSFAGLDRWQNAVIHRMIAELREASEALGPREISSVYIGGGTPSVLKPELLTDLLRAARETFQWMPRAEVSIEMNPGTVTAEFLQAALEGGVNRVSIGAQSADDRLLKLLGRIHNARDINRTIRMLKAYGVTNFNLDMMLGLPGQTIQQAVDTLDTFLSYGPTHLSCYSLIVEDGTPLKTQVSEGRLRLPDEDLAYEMASMVTSRLEARGYHRYEVSNYAKDGYRCRHNLDCWMRREYLGIGVGAASFLGNTRKRNPATIAAYLNGCAPQMEVISHDDACFESLMLGLRLTDGLSAAHYQEMHGESVMERFGPVIRRQIDQGLLEWCGDCLRCTGRGMDLLNRVLTELM